MPRDLLADIEPINKEPRDLLADIEPIEKAKHRDLLADVETIEEKPRKTLFNKIENFVKLNPFEKTVKTLDALSRVDLTGTLKAFSDLEKVSPGSLESTVKGVASFPLSLPSTVGGLAREFGERAEEIPNFFAPENQFLKEFKYPFMLGKALSSQFYKGTDIDENITEAAKNMIAKNQEFLQKYEIKPKEGGKLNDFLFNLGSGVSTLAGAVGLTALTKNPAAAAGLFGVIQRGNLYQEAREAGVEPKKSGNLATLGQIAETGLEYAGLDFMLNRFKGMPNLLRSLVTAGSEGFQEFSQEFSENVIKKLGWNKPGNVFEETGQAALIGMLLGGGASMSMSMAEQSGTVDQVQKGLNTTKEKAANIVEGLINKQTPVALEGVKTATKETQPTPEPKKPSLIERTTEAREGLYQDYFNRMQSIENIVGKAKKLGADIKPGEDPALQARSYLGIGQKVESVLRDKTYRISPEGNIEITGEGLKPILDNYEKISVEQDQKIRDDDLRDYLISKRTVADLQRTVGEGKRQRTIATEEQTKQAQEKLDSLNKKYGDNIQQIEQTAQRLYAYQQRVLHLLVDSGNMSEDQYNSILQNNPNYVPFDRVMDEAGFEGGTPISKKRFTGARTPVKKIKGSERAIENPIESMIKNTYKIMDVAERNNVSRNMAKLSEILPEDISPVKVQMQPVKLTEKEAGEEKIIFRPSQFKPKGNVIEYFENGKRKYIEVTPNLYQAMTGLNETSLGLFVSLMSKPASFLRTGATITPEFMARNFMRDQWTAIMQTNFGFRPFIDSTRAIADVLRRTDIYNDWLRSGGAYSGFVELSRPKLQKAYKQLKNPKTASKIFGKLNVITTAQEISQLLEQATRVGAFKAALRKGLSPVEAGFESREATLDFSRRGSKTKDFNAMIAFFNAGLQSVDKSIRSVKTDPVGFAAKGVATITIPSLISYMLNRDDPEYKELPRWQKDLFWIFKVGKTFIRIPKPFSYGQIFGSIPERFFEYLDNRDRTAFAGLAESLYNSISPIAGDPFSGLMPIALRPLAENTSNWNYFLKRNIVTPIKARLTPEKQYNKYTSETAKILGRLGKYSPAKIENFVSGWFGGSGKYALEAGDVLINGIREFTGQKVPSKRPRELADIPLIKGFVTRPAYGMGSQSVQNFYDNREKINQTYNTYRALLKEGNTKEAGNLIKKNPEWVYAKILNKYATAISKQTAYIDVLAKSEKPEKEKRELIKKSERMIVDLAKKANELIKKK